MLVTNICLFIYIFNIKRNNLNAKCYIYIDSL